MRPADRRSVAGCDVNVNKECGPMVMASQQYQLKSLTFPAKFQAHVRGLVGRSGGRSLNVAIANPVRTCLDPVNAYVWKRASSSI
jgi:hypothetical protein